jgi:ABC-type lipoprotein release transport system permease subunit
MTLLQRLEHLPMWAWFLVAVAPFVALSLLSQVPLQYNVRNLTVRWRITLLTALAFTVVVALLVVMYAFVNGMAQLTEGGGQPGNVIILADGATDELFSNLGYSAVNDIEHKVADKDEEGRSLEQPLVTDTVKRQGKQWPLCSWETYIIVNQPIPLQPGQPARRRFVQVRGIVDPDISARVHNLSLQPGGAWFSDAGVQAAPTEHNTKQDYTQAVLGQSVARELGRDQHKPSLVVGDVFELADRKWIVVGIMASLGSTFDSEIWAKHQIVADRFLKKNYTSIVLRVRDGDVDDAKVMSAYLTKNFRPAVQALPEVEYYAKLSNTNEQFLWGIRFVAFFMAVGGIAGIMNTMFAAISARSKDIGVLRILGFSRWQILLSFLLESVAMALVGGLIGCALGSLADGWTATSIISGGQGGGKSVVLKLIVDANILATGMLFALAMGVLGGLVPSLSAMRLKPLDAVR